MCNMNGYVKIYRQMQDWEWYDEPNTLRLWIHCLFNANFEDKKWRGQIIKAGSFVTSLAKLSEQLKLSIQQIRTALSNIQTTGEITRESTNGYTLINVVNWAKFQGGEIEINTPNNKRITHNSTNEQQTDNNNVINKELKKKESSKESISKDIPKKEISHIIFGEFRHVRLTQEQYDKLQKDFQNADELIKHFDEYMEEKPNYKSANHNLAIRRWVVDAVQEKSAKKQNAKGGVKNDKVGTSDEQPKSKYDGYTFGIEL